MVKTADTDKGILLDSALALAQTQLSAQATDDAGFDSRTTGLVGLNGALLAADIAAKDVLGALWWTPLIVLVISTGMLLVTLFGADRKGVDVGVRAALFYEVEGAEHAIPALELLLAELNKAFEFNEGRLGRKRARLQRALVTLLSGLVIAGLLITINRPTKMESCPRNPCSSRRQSSHTPGPPAASEPRPRWSCSPQSFCPAEGTPGHLGTPHPHDPD